MLPVVEISAKQIGPNSNNSKTGYIKFNQGERDLKMLNGELLKNVDFFFVVVVRQTEIPVALTKLAVLLSSSRLS